ncbi:MAG: 6-phosphofructokinase [Alphaproteobacteria bacterium]|nr:6-phosphofructokinase [Alphaproteobacteria bacterium]MBR4316083.1 6-phosphofructokinase [Alphaproteobacteria bacterium]
MLSKKSNKKKRIAILTGGGDCPGLNMAIKAVSQYAMNKYGWEVMGVKNALNGLLDEIKFDGDDADIIPFTPSFSFSEYVRQGGTFLGSFRKLKTKKFKDVKSDEELVEVMLPFFKKHIKELNIDGMIATGGDGTMFMLNFLCEKVKIPFVGIPKTIDNDTPGTEISIGFSSSVDACVNALDSIFWTAKGHRRAIVTQVMGRNTGHLAMHSGVASCADVILTPEIPYTLSGVIKKVKSLKTLEKRDYAVIVVAEGAGLEKGKPLPKNADYTVAEYIAKALDKAGIEARADNLGYIQRGGLPNGYDRMLAAELGVLAVDLMAEGHTAVMAGMKDGKPAKVLLKNVCKKETRGLNLSSPIVKTAKNLGIYIGEKIKK